MSCSQVGVTYETLAEIRRWRRSGGGESTGHSHPSLACSQPLRPSPSAWLSLGSGGVPSPSPSTSHCCGLLGLHIALEVLYPCGLSAGSPFPEPLQSNLWVCYLQGL